MERIPINAYAERVDGLVLPAPLSGHPVLDFCNTFSGWDGTDAGDYLKTYDHAVVWAVAGGLMEPAAAATLRRRAARRPEEAEAALRRVRGFRTDLYAILTKRSAR